MTPGIILALGAVATFILATVLHHRRETAALYLPGPRTPERDQGFDEGLEHAVGVLNNLVVGEDSVTRAGAATVIKAIRAARRGGR